MIVRSKEATASGDLMHSLHHGPGKRKPVIGRRAAPDFIQNDEAPLGCLTENRGGFDHFDHEGGASPRQIVRRSEEHTSELQSLMRISYAVFCLKQPTLTQ